MIKQDLQKKDGKKKQENAQHFPAGKTVKKGVKNATHFSLPEGWVETTLGEVVETNSETIKKDYSFKNILYLDTGSITKGDIEELKEIELSEAPSRAKRLVKNFDIVYSTVRPNQEHYGFIENPKENLVVSTGFTVVSANQETSYPKFLYYFLTQKRITQEMQQIAEHSVSTYPSIKPENLKSLKINLPPLPQQKAIAKMLSAFDDKIELLREQNETLEKIGQEIFKEWFGKYKIGDDEVNSDEGGREGALGQLPDGWRVGKLSEVADFLNGLALQKYPPKQGEKNLPVIKIRELKQGITENTDMANTDLDKKYIVKNGDILFSWSGSLEVVIWKYGEGALNQHLFKVTSEEYPKWFYYYWTLYHLKEFKNVAANKATTMGHINRRHLDDAVVFIPDEKTMKNIGGILSVNLQKIENNNFQIQTLSQTRDTLLSKLMKGEIILSEK